MAEFCKLVGIDESSFHVNLTFRQKDTSGKSGYKYTPVDNFTDANYLIIKYKDPTKEDPKKAKIVRLIPITNGVVN